MPQGSITSNLGQTKWRESDSSVCGWWCIHCPRENCYISMCIPHTVASPELFFRPLYALNVAQYAYVCAKDIYWSYRQGIILVRAICNRTIERPTSQRAVLLLMQQYFLRIFPVQNAPNNPFLQSKWVNLCSLWIAWGFIIASLRKLSIHIYNNISVIWI